MSRRFTIGFALALSLVTLPFLKQSPWLLPISKALAKDSMKSPQRVESKKRRVVIFGSHPDDPEFSCGGLITRLTEGGHEVILAYASCYRGKRLLDGQPENDVRRREATAACEVLGATPYFFDYDHETMAADTAAVQNVSKWLKETKPDIVITHWPLDTHPNHHVTSSLVWQAYLLDRKWHLYFFESLTDYQTVAFKPDLFVDITEVRDIKREACIRHQSQKPEKIWIDQDDVQRRRGEECGVHFAEAFLLAEPLAGRAQLPVATLKRKE